MARESPIVIGWKERVSFPDWKVRRVRVKIDTGARTSALGADFYNLADDPQLGRVVELTITFDRKRPELQTNIRAPVLGQAVVCNSSGMKEQRPVIETTVRLGPVTKLVRFTIANRTRMRFPVILGRRALVEDFLIDVEQSFTQKTRRK
jgi:hypothetical protein